MTQNTDFKRKVKHALLDLDKTQTWLAQQVSEKTGLYVDGGYFSKIFRGERNAPRVVAAICEILDIQK